MANSHASTIHDIRSIDARELRKAMKALGFKISKESVEEMIGEQ